GQHHVRQLQPDSGVVLVERQRLPVGDRRALRVLLVDRLVAGLDQVGIGQALGRRVRGRQAVGQVVRRADQIVGGERQLALALLFELGRGRRQGEGARGRAREGRRGRHV